MREVAVLLAVCGMVQACTEVRYVEVPAPVQMAENSRLQACEAHASRAQKSIFGSDFRMLQLSSAGVVAVKTQLPVGKQKVSQVYDGEGAWYGASEYRKVRFHCMFSDSGQVLYSFVRGL